MDAWNLLMAGRTEEAIALMSDARDRSPDASEIMQLGVAYLWTRRYDAALEHFGGAIKSYPWSMDAFFGMFGVAFWCLDMPGDAVKVWESGLAANYTDADRIHLPLLLHAAAVIRPGIFSIERSEQLLENRIAASRYKRWPVPAAQFLIRQIDATAMMAACIDNRDSVTKFNRWNAAFYEGVGALQENDCRRFRAAMGATASPQWKEDSDFFLSCVWTEEYFIARAVGDTSR